MTGSWLEAWLAKGLGGTWIIRKTGAETDKCLEPGCGVERQNHSKKTQGHFFKEA